MGADDGLQQGGRHLLRRAARAVERDPARGVGLRRVTMSDWYGTHSTAPAALAGLDLEMPGPPSWLGPNLADRGAGRARRRGGGRRAGSPFARPDGAGRAARYGGRWYRRRAGSGRSRATGVGAAASPPRERYCCATTACSRSIRRRSDRVAVIGPNALPDGDGRRELRGHAAPAAQRRRARWPSGCRRRRSPTRWAAASTGASRRSTCAC